MIGTRDGGVRRLMSGWRRSRSSEPTVPADSRIYAIGDIHGRADLLAVLHRMIRADAEQAPARRVVVYLGDYVDRGLRSREVIDLLLSAPLDGFDRIHLKGNHEGALLEFLHDGRIGPVWMRVGGDATLASYGVPRVAGVDAAAFEETRQRFAEALPEDHARFLRRLALWHEEGDYRFVHAGVRPGVPLDGQSEEDLLWIRDDFLLHRGRLERVIVHGHTITDEPDVQLNRIGIDTGAFATGRLTCLVLEGTERRFLMT